jgi:Flp pilus assembly pilin Flp
MPSLSLKSKYVRGQGLVEYAVILALVALVVIAGMRILGPKVGNTFSAISSSLPANEAVAVPTAVPTVGPWVVVAPEGGSVNVPAGVHEIQYGANGSYVTRTYTGPTTVGCNNSTFGDPIYGVVKSCSIR